MPEFLNYKKDVIFGMEWEWEWIDTGKYWDLSDLHVNCSKDHTPMLISHDPILKNNYCECPRCHSQLEYSDVDFKKVHIIIHDNIDKSMYPED